MNTVVIRPIITEKATGMAARGVYTFEVERYSRKGEIATAIEKMFGVHVTEVRTAIMHGKMHRTGKRRTEITSEDWKKVFIELKKGEKIDIFEVGGTE
jgi:large subunit ribosomal protein L23